VQNGAKLAVIVVELGVVTAAVLVSEIALISTSIVGVVVSDGPDPHPKEPHISRIAVGVVAVTDVELDMPLPVTPLQGEPVQNAAVEPFTVKLYVTPVGIPVNVNSIWVLFSLAKANGTPLFESCALLRQAPAKPPVMRMEAVSFAFVLLVRMAAVPRFGCPVREPMATLAIPDPSALMAVKLVVVSK